MRFSPGARRRLTRGGLVVHLGCGEGELTAALRANDSYLVQGLDSDAAKVDKARQTIASMGLYGPVSVDRLRGSRLRYIDNGVNLLVVSGSSPVAREEILRVLCPGGAAVFTTDNGQLTDDKLVKPRPGEMDEWTHYLHDPTNNAVSHDTLVDPPRHLQWVAGPKWSRHHDHMSSSSAIVSAGGRNFYIFDEAPNLSIQLPSRWALIARDAFSGVLLWKRPIASWHTQMWRLKSGPASLPRRLVAIGDTVYVTLSYDGPVEALDATTGRTLRSFAETKGTEEILVSDGVLFALTRQTGEDQPLDPKGHNYEFSESARTILAIQAETGQVLWRQPWKWAVQGTLTVDSQRALFYDGQNLICLDRKTGEKTWQTESVSGRTSVPSYFSPTLVSYNGVVLFSGSDPAVEDYHKDNGKTLQAYDAATGQQLWTAPHPPSGYRSPEDILVVDGLAWTTETMFGNQSGVFTGRDPQTGEVKVEFPPDVDTHWFHHRCYRAKATDKYILASRTGIEFVDVKEKHWTCHHWVRGACLYGVMPANGMVYTSPHPCACYLEAKLFGFNALAPARPQVQKSKSEKVEKSKSEERLEKGPAYEISDPKSQISNLKSNIRNSADWPAYRHDAARSGFTKGAVPAELKPAWERKLGGRLSSVVIADGRVFVAEVDAHTVYALAAHSRFSRKPQYFRWTTPLERQLFACAKQPEILREQPKPKTEPAESAKKKERRAAKSKAANETQPADKPATPPKEQPAAKKKAFNAGAQPDARVAYQWTQQLPIHVRALVLADRTLFVAGPPDLVDEETSLRSFADPATREKLAEQVAALEGKQGSLLLAVSATDGKQLAEIRLDTLPVFDGMAAADGKLFLATTDGWIVCFGKP